MHEQPNRDGINPDFFTYFMEENLMRMNNTEESRLKQIHKDHLFEMMDTHINTEQKMMMAEIFEELNQLSDREIRLTYEKGFKDCVLLLKQLKVLA